MNDKKTVYNILTHEERAFAKHFLDNATVYKISYRDTTRHLLATFNDIEKRIEYDTIEQWYENINLYKFISTKL